MIEAIPYGIAAIVAYVTGISVALFLFHDTDFWDDEE